MARKTANLKLEERVGTIRTPVSTPRIPRWLLYSGIGTAALGILAAGYLGLRSLGVPLPPQPRQAEQGQEQQYNPPQNGSEVTQQIPGIENILTQQQIVEYVTGLQGRQLITSETLQKIAAVNESLYFHFTGKTFQQSRFETTLLTEQEYKALEGKPGGTIPNSEGIIGIMADGTINVYAHSYLGEKADPLRILTVLARETGNAEAERHSKKNYELGITDVDKYLAGVSEKYGLGDISGLYIGGVERESLQTLYQAAVFHYLEEFGVIVHPSLSDGGKDIDATVDAMVSSNNFFVQASLLDWYRAIHHTDTRESLQKTGKITSQQAIGLFNAYIQESQTREGFDQTVVEIVTAVKTSPQYAQQIKDAAKLSNRPAEFVFFP